MAKGQQQVDVVIIGGGPAGYVGAIRAAQFGMKVVCVERDKLGGICLNWGCIPTKALLAGAELYSKLKHDAADWGIEADNIRHDWKKVIARSRSVADTLNRGIHSLFKKHRIEHIEGHAFIPKAGRVEVYASDDAKRQGAVKQTLQCRQIIIATGAGPRPLPDQPFDGKRIIHYKQAMTLEEQPEKMLVIGAGAIGMEFAYFYNAFGTKVTVVEMLPRLLPIEDDEVSQTIARSFKKQGIETYTGHKTVALTASDSGVKATIAPLPQDDKSAAKPEGKGYGSSGSDQPAKAKDGDEKTAIEADVALVAIGVKGRYDGLFDNDLGLELHKDHIKVDRSDYATSVEGVYAVGDVIGPPWLAHVASEEAVVCIERIAGHEPVAIDYDAIPGCTYCHPQVASLGLTERACREQGLKIKVGKFPLQASGKARALGETEGFVKLIADEKYGELLGCHMIGESVTELIAEISLGKRLEATATEIIAAIHPHPTLSESVHEAALGAEGRMIHF